MSMFPVLRAARRWFFAAVSVLTSLTAVAADDAEALAEKMLTALGGRAAWAAVTNTINESQQNRLTEPNVVRAVITMDFAQPRLRIDTTAPDLKLVRVVDGEKHWRISRDGELLPVSDETLAIDRRWYQGHVYRTLMRIARRDPALRLALGTNGRLEVFEQGTRIAWYAVDSRGEPYAFAGPNDERGSLSGPWEYVAGGIHHPIWTASADGSIRARLISLKVNVPLTDALFARPSS